MKMLQRHSLSNEMKTGATEKSSDWSIVDDSPISRLDLAMYVRERLW